MKIPSRKFVLANMGDVNAIMVDPKDKVFLIASVPRNEF